MVLNYSEDSIKTLDGRTYPKTPMNVYRQIRDEVQR